MNDGPRASVTAGARTPWAPRNGALAAVHPEELLGLAIGGVAAQRGVSPHRIDRLLVACDTSVGAQDLNLGRRAALALGWQSVPALTVDGQGSGDLALVGLAATLPGVTVVAAVDATSVVPPGAGLVRDYGRPRLEEPPAALLERLAIEGGLDRAMLDEQARQLAALPGDPAIGTSEWLVPVARSDGETCELDIGVDAADLDQLEPAGGDSGLLTAGHDAPLADGAAAVLVESSVVGRREITGHTFAAGAPEEVVARLTAACPDGVVMLAESSAVIHALVDRLGCSRVAAVGALGSAPAADGLRMLVDGVHACPDDFTVIRRGRFGQVAAVSIASGMLATPS